MWVHEFSFIKHLTAMPAVLENLNRTNFLIHQITKKALNLKWHSKEKKGVLKKLHRDPINRNCSIHIIYCTLLAIELYKVIQDNVKNILENQSKCAISRGQILVYNFIYKNIKKYSKTCSEDQGRRSASLVVGSYRDAHVKSSICIWEIPKKTMTIN